MGFVLTSPKKLPFKQIRQIALGEAHTLVLDFNDCLRVFGWSELG